MEHVKSTVTCSQLLGQDLLQMVTRTVLFPDVRRSLKLQFFQASFDVLLALFVPELKLLVVPPSGCHLAVMLAFIVPARLFGGVGHLSSDLRKVRAPRTFINHELILLDSVLLCLNIVVVPCLLLGISLFKFFSDLMLAATRAKSS